MLSQLREEPTLLRLEQQGSMSQKKVANPAVFNRSNYMKVLSSYALRDLPVPASR
jgi:hypothetical protein